MLFEQRRYTVWTNQNENIYIKKQQHTVKKKYFIDMFIVFFFKEKVLFPQ